MREQALEGVQNVRIIYFHKILGLFGKLIGVIIVSG